MSDFVVSARKYRPADFVSVVGQVHVTGTLKNAIARGQLAHAYLFCGPRGVGKTTCARIFAKAINCLNPKESEACGECESCRAMAEGRSFNIHELDAASNNSVDDIRSLTEQVRIPPQVGRYSVYIIDEVHMLSAAAFNAFLKTLEEPPAHAIFILATTEKHKILPTILSRCQIFDFNRIRVEDGVEYLRYIAGQQGVKADDESLHLIALKADGGMRDALSMFDKAVSFCGDDLQFKDVARTLNVLDYDTYFNMAAQLLAGDYQSVLATMDEVVRAGFSPGSLASGLNGHFRDLLVSKDPKTLPLLEVSGTLLERYKRQGEEFPPEFLFEAIGVLTAVDGGLRTATNQRLNVELSLMKIAGLGQKKNEDIGFSPSLPQLRPADGSQPVLPQKTVPENIQKPKLEPAPVSVSAVEPISIPAPRQEVRTAAAPKTTTRKTILSGNSISDILNAAPKGAQDLPAGEEEAPAVEVVDPDSESKINTAREQFLDQVHSHRPRIAMALDEMKVSGNVVSVSVPSEQLREEILRNRTEILTTLTDVAGIVGRVDLVVEVSNDTSVRKPIKAEDKLRHLLERNPALALLRKGLNLEIE